jgi:CheY-like chemotaxis protein
MSPGQQDGEAQFTPQQNVQHGMGQSKSSRRRRRKRKNKGSDAQQAAQSGGDQSAGQPVASIQGSAAAQASQPQSFQAGAGQQQNSPSGGGKRWKKKFRDRDRQRSQENPGNVASGSNGGYSNNGGGYRDRDTHQPGNSSGGFKRKGGKQQQRGPRSFVGPMDHSYRAVNGNFADAPPSTMDSHSGNYQGRSNGHGGGRYQSDSQPIDYSQGRPIPIPENAPTKIFFFIEDLFFIAKIQETARKLGVKVAFVKNEKDAIAALTAGEEEDRPGLIVFDLNNANAKPLTLIPKLKAKLKRSTSIVGFLSHLQGDLKAKAVEAGCDTVMPRAAFSQNLPNLLRRYGMEEEEEPNFNQ